MRVTVPLPAGATSSYFRMFKMFKMLFSTVALVFTCTWYLVRADSSSPWAFHGESFVSDRRGEKWRRVFLCSKVALFTCTIVVVTNCGGVPVRCRSD